VRYPCKSHSYGGPVLRRARVKTHEKTVPKREKNIHNSPEARKNIKKGVLRRGAPFSSSPGRRPPSPGPPPRKRPAQEPSDRTLQSRGGIVPGKSKLKIVPGLFFKKVEDSGAPSSSSPWRRHRNPRPPLQRLPEPGPSCPCPSSPSAPPPPCV